MPLKDAVKHREYTKKYYQEHAEQRRAYARQYHREHRPSRLAYHTIWRRAHKEHEAQYSQEYKLTRAINDHITRIKTLTHYGNGTCKCVMCGFSDIRVLSIDHIAGNGAEHRRVIKRGGIGFYHWLDDNAFPEGYQTLCMNCQFLKKKANREYK